MSLFLFRANVLKSSSREILKKVCSDPLTINQMLSDLWAEVPEQLTAIQRSLSLSAGLMGFTVQWENLTEQIFSHSPRCGPSVEVLLEEFRRASAVVWRGILWLCFRGGVTGEGTHTLRCLRRRKSHPRGGCFVKACSVHANTHRCAHTFACPLHTQQTQVRGEQKLAASYLQEVTPLAVDVHKVVVDCDELLGLPDEEGCAVQLWPLGGEGELPLYAQHVNAPCGSGDKGLLPLPALEAAPCQLPPCREGGDRTDPPALGSWQRGQGEPAEAIRSLLSIRG